MPPQRHAGKVGYGPNYDPSAVSPRINILFIAFFIQPTNIPIGIYLDTRRQGNRSEGGADGEDHA